MGNECDHLYQLLNNGLIALDGEQPSLMHLDRSSEQLWYFSWIKSLALVYLHIGSY